MCSVERGIYGKRKKIIYEGYNHPYDINIINTGVCLVLKDSKYQYTCQNTFTKFRYDLLS